jgi:Ca2+/Na+ antiporter
LGLGDSVFTIIFIMMGAAAIVTGLNFEKKHGAKFKGSNKEEYIKLNKIVLILMGGIMLFGTFLGQGIPAFKDVITNITMGSLLIIWVVYSVTSKKKFSNKK